MKLPVFLLGLVITGAPAARGLATDKPPPVRATAANPGDTCGATRAGDKLLVEITTERGIGRATVESPAGPLPENITLRLRYTTGKPLPTLEGLTLTTATFTLEGATARPDDFQLTRRDGKKDAENGKPAAAEKQKLTVRPTESALEIDLPKNLLGDARKFGLHWVDYYRN